MYQRPLYQEWKEEEEFEDKDDVLLSRHADAQLMAFCTHNRFSINSC